MIAKSLRIAGLASILVMLTQCDQVHALFKPKPAKPGPYAFDLTLEMSPKAEAELKQPGKGLSIDASYYGDAAPAYRSEADKLNRIYLGEERWDYSAGARRIHLHGEPIDTSKLPQTRDGEVQTVVSVHLSESSPDDPFTCHYYVGPVRRAQQYPQVVRCELDGETYWDSHDTAASSS
ncbi:MAG: hypothetical protein ACXU8U_06915 [Asticcacaulis sp.]